ncbi:MAG: TonB-dependent receptor [Muribaculaceae bacterium]|nr:TonB-dependent receptor [Muribaculaceae bacterium]
MSLKKVGLAIALVLLLPISAFSQQQIVTVNINSVPLNKAMAQISKQAGMNVAYSKEFVDVDRLVSLSVSNKKLNEALAILFKGTDVGFKFQNNNILLYKKSSQVEKEGETTGITVNGLVLDKVTGEPVIGATVLVEGTNIGAATDYDGKFTLRMNENSTLTVSYVGYNSYTQQVRRGGDITINLKENATQLEDLVVVGYGTQKKLNLTGAVSMVKGDVLENRPITTVGAGLQGAIPGVTITQATGEPGSAPSIRVRGVSTINSSTSPLVLIDGVAGGDMNLLNPADIESVSVLKDAASAAIYGARAANGVILITTKTGKSKEKATLSYNGYVGWQTPTAQPELVSGREYMDLQNEAMSAAGFSKPYDDEAYKKYDSGLFPNEFSNTDWIGEVYKKSAFQTGHNLSVRGGSDKSSYFLSYGFLDQDGLVVGDSFKSRRHNARLSVNTTVFDKLKINGNMSFVDFYKSECGYSGTSGVFRLAQRMSPLLPVKWQEQAADGMWNELPYYSNGMVRNPLDVAYNSGTNKRKSRVFNGIVGADWNIFDELHLTGQYSANYYFRATDEFNPVMPQYFSDGTPKPENVDLRNSVYQAQLDILSQTLQATLKYNKTIAEKHEIGALLGFSQEWEERGSLSASRKNILIDGIEVVDAGTEDIANSGTKESWALMSYFGRVNYAFDGKYLVEANMRIDGTSRFNKDNRWGYFPSFSAGWNFYRESFMEWAKPYLTTGKLRASWGELGNQNVGSTYYPYLTSIERIEKSYPIGGISNVGFLQTKLGNKDIKWETIRMFNIGIDMSFFDNRLGVNFDWYKKNNLNALVQPIFPTLVGITGSANLPYENMGEIENKGWELGLSWRDKIGEVKYSVDFNLSDSRNKIIDLGHSNPSLSEKIRRVGDPIGAYYGYLTDGLAQASDFEGYDEKTGKYFNPKFAVPKAAEGVVQPGDIKYRDVTGEGTVDEKDKVVFGDPYPHFIYSLKGQVAWRGIDFSFYFQGVGQVNGYLKDEARHCFINDYSIPKVEHLDRWTPTNTGAQYPRLYQAQTHNLLFSDYWLEDASYLRLKNIQIGYTLPKKWLAPAKITNLRVYASADNLLTFTKYFGGYDPEVRETSGDSYPQVKTYIFGLQLTF